LQYLIVGGMPAAVNEFMNTNSFVAVADIQNRILNEYIADMAKYKSAYGIRISRKNFGFENGIKSVPLYAAFCIG